MRDSEVLHHLINGARKRYGLRPARWNRKLYLLAKEHSKKMANDHGIFHSFKNRPWGGENVLSGPSDMTPEAMFKAWWLSQDHRAWIYHPDIKYAAAAIIRTKHGTYATWSFGFSKVRENIKKALLVFGPLVVAGILYLIASSSG